MSKEEYEKYLAEAADVRLSDFYSDMYEDYLRHNLSVKEINAQLNAEERHDFWEDFRLRYREAFEDSDTMLEVLRVEKENNIRTPRRNRRSKDVNADNGGKRPDSGIPKHEREKKPLPEPEVPRGGRRRGHAPRESANPIVRTIRGIGRRIFRRRK